MLIFPKGKSAAKMLGLFVPVARCALSGCCEIGNIHNPLTAYIVGVGILQVGYRMGEPLVLRNNSKTPPSCILCFCSNRGGTHVS
ncbi:uncharacterized protein F4807DRAFT_423121 [Annulohypoxylon truncatum]|uniref:uncharacterized protein n=1 Tax=Annulohypoxylon truncatum TaxID=327061 RepID=UPI0020085AD1|nr:uncharacterized protein F4807DRAFT_423121 [Annulohypoxylon truncatum]KAI1210374.1 hypothetical protein F4807DRAFT_423121 [Annulohypoxylon truncatum]